MAQRSEAETEVDLELGLDEALADDEEGEREPREEAHDEPQPDFGTADYQKLRKRNFIIQREGKEFVLYAGLLDLLHQVSRGFFEIKTGLAQAPSTENAQTAICTATVSILDADDHITPIRTASGIGDAYPGNVSKVMGPHSIRMAETRAIARALRSLLNVGMAALEELGGGPGSAPASGGGGGSSSGGQEGITIQGQRYSRAQIWEAYQNRMGQMREARLPIPNGAALGQNAPLGQLAGATQALKKKLTEAGKLPASGGNGRNN